MQTIFHKRVIGVTLVVLVMLIGSSSGCGDGGDEPASPAFVTLKEPPTVPPPPPVIRKESPRWSREDWDDDILANARGVLVNTNGSEIRGWGDRRVRRYVTALFARIQYDFLTGNMAAVCKRVDPHPLRAFISTVDPDTPCEEALTRYAQDLEKRRFRSPPLRFLWVRAYPGVAGIWVEDNRGNRFRVPFVEDEGKGWELQLAELRPPEALGMPLVDR